MSKITRDNYVLGTASLAEGTNANTIQVASILHYVIAGRAYRKAVTDNVALAAHPGTSFVAVAALKAVCFFLMADAAGAITAIQDTTITSPTASGGQPYVWEWPDRDGYACIGALVIRTDGSATFTAAATDLGATDVVDVFVAPAPDYGHPVRISATGVAS